MYWGTYDTGKPRNRIIQRGLRDNNVQVTECHANVWAGVEDKSQIKHLHLQIWFFVRWLACYPRLVVRFLRAPRPEVIIVGYLGHLDILVLWPLAKLKRVPVVWDAFLSLHDTVVYDRALIHKYNPLALLLYLWEWLACRAADYVILDTRAHADFFVERFKLNPAKVGAVYVGAEPEVFQKILKSAKTAEVSLLFYGQFIPLHGIENIIEASQLVAAESTRWLVIGTGQEAKKIERLLKDGPYKNLHWLDWVAYEDLPTYIGAADICLGIFGTSDKAARVIPNKVFQIIMAGKPLITRDSPAIRELLGAPGLPVKLIAPGSAEALARAVRQLIEELPELRENPYQDIVAKISPQAVGRQLLKQLETIV